MCTFSCISAVGAVSLDPQKKTAAGKPYYVKKADHGHHVTTYTHPNTVGGPGPSTTPNWVIR